MSCENWFQSLAADTAARLQEVQDSMAYFSKLSICILNSKGIPYTISSNQSSCSYNYQCKNDNDNCNLVILRGIKEAEKKLEPVMLTCPEGLTTTIVPLGDFMLEKQSNPCAYLFLGKVFIGEENNAEKNNSKKKPMFTQEKYQQAVNSVSKIFELIFVLLARGNNMENIDNAFLNDFKNKDYTVLTKRELEVLKRIGTGISNNAIANQLYISDSTVKTHITNIMSKLDMGNRTELALYAVQALQLNKKKNI
jgi:DNA-binding CsgD family transcriptional regulator/ligand-binding sensor protein